MAVTKTAKKEALDTLKQVFKDATSVAFVHFRGLTVAETDKLRKKLRHAGVKYVVGKKTLVRIALDGQTIAGSRPVFEGELGMAYGADLLAPAREVYGFEKEFDKKIAIVGGIFEGRYMSKAEMTGIAMIPPLQTLHAQFVNLINTPIQQLVVSLSEIAKKKA